MADPIEIIEIDTTYSGRVPARATISCA